MIRYFLRLDPDTLSDEKWAEVWQGLRWVREQEKSIKGF
nr:MAG TPA: hypothetical protein [Caudoviricetes sp.]